jgi:hypothetical protein
MLEKKVKKFLIEVKEKKERKLIEESLIKNRLSMIFEGITCKKDFKSLSESKQLKLSVKFIQEMSFLQNNGLIVEQELGNQMSKLFGNGLGNLTQTMFEPIIRKMLKPLFEEGILTDFLVSYLTSRPSDIIVKSFNDCKLMTNLISKGISESIVMQIQKNTSLTDPGYNFIRNTIGDVLSGTEFITKIEDGLESKVCNVLNEFSGNAEKVVNKLKSGLTA